MQQLDQMVQIRQECSLAGSGYWWRLLGPSSQLLNAS